MSSLSSLVKSSHICCILPWMWMALCLDYPSCMLFLTVSYIAAVIVVKPVVTGLQCLHSRSSYLLNNGPSVQEQWCWPGVVLCTCTASYCQVLGQPGQHSKTSLKNKHNRNAAVLAIALQYLIIIVLFFVHLSLCPTWITVSCSCLCRRRKTVWHRVGYCWWCQAYLGVL